MDPIRHLFVLSLLSACSLGITGPSPDRPRREVPKCDTGKGLVAVDGVLGASMGLAGIAVASEGNDSAGALLALAGTAFVLSAVHGNSKANACREDFVKFTLETPGLDDDDERARIARQAGRRLTRPAAFQPSLPLPPTPPLQPARVSEQAAPPVAPPVAPPPVARPAAKEPPASPPKQQSDEWHDFWQEVP